MGARFEKQIEIENKKDEGKRALIPKVENVLDLYPNLQTAEQKARATYEKLIDLCADDPDVIDPLKFLREREIVHFQRFGEALRGVQDKLAQKKFYMNNRNRLVDKNNNMLPSDDDE